MTLDINMLLRLTRG